MTLAGHISKTALLGMALAVCAPMAPSPPPATATAVMTPTRSSDEVPAGPDVESVAPDLLASDVSAAERALAQLVKMQSDKAMTAMVQALVRADDERRGLIYASLIEGYGGKGLARTLESQLSGPEEEAYASAVDTLEHIGSLGDPSAADMARRFQMLRFDHGPHTLSRAVLRHRLRQVPEPERAEAVLRMIDERMKYSSE